MRKSVLKLMTLITAGAMILSAPFSASAAEMGEVSVGEPPVAAEESELAPAIAMTPDGEIIYAPEEMPEDLPEPELEPEIIVPVEEPIDGGRSERLAYLGCMRYHFGEERPLWEYAEWLITEEGWDPNGWLYELLGELYPDESPYPEPIECPVEEPIIDGFESFKAMFGGMRYLYPEINLEEYAQMYIDDLTKHTTDPERIDYETRWVWTAAVELYPEEVANEVSIEKWQYYDPERLGRPFMLDIGSFHNDYEGDPNIGSYGDQSESNQSQENGEWVEIAEPVTFEVNGVQVTIHHMGKVDSNDQANEDAVEDLQPDTGCVASAEDLMPQLPEYSISGDPVEYVVEKGDNLWAISEKLYGDGKYWFIIANTNTDRINNPRVIYAGQILIVPGVAFTR